MFRSEAAAPAAPTKFSDPEVTATGAPRAKVALGRLRTLWFNTGTLCNIACANCYIESSPTNDRLVYLSAGEVAAYLDEIAQLRLPVEEIGFTGGEPFMNRELAAMLADVLGRGYRALVLTNAMRPMMRSAEALGALKARWGTRLVLRVSLDHYGRERHESERGPRSWERTLDGLDWLCANGFTVHVAGRTRWGEAEDSLRAGYARLFAERGYPIDAASPVELVLFPEMDADADVPEITEGCWETLGVAPDSVMCASSRMVVKRKGAREPTVVACTLLPDDAAFDLGPRLADAGTTVALNHPHCARFCVLGGGACNAG